MMGFPGSGKTTAALWVSELTGATHIWADRERTKRFAKPTHSREETAELYSALNLDVEALLRQGKSVVYDANFNQRRTRRHWRKLAMDSGAATVVLWVDVSPETAYQRTKNHNKTRVFTLARSVFDRMAGHLQPPQADEQYIKIDGTKLTRTDVAAALRPYSAS